MNSKSAQIFVHIFFFILLPLFLFASDLSDYKKYGHKSPAWSPLVEAGFLAMEGGNINAAMGFFERAIGKGCKDGLVFLKVGTYYESNKDFERALEYFRLAEKHLPRYKTLEAAKTIHEHIGRVLYQLGRTAEAKKELLEAVRAQGDNFTITFLLGTIAKDEGDDQRVVTYYTKALTLPPPNGINLSETTFTILLELGKAHYNLKEYSKAEAIFNQVISIAPDNAIARRYLSNISYRKVQDSLKESNQKLLEQILR